MIYAYWNAVRQLELFRSLRLVGGGGGDGSWKEWGGGQLQLVSWWTFAQADQRLADSGERER